MVLVLLVSVSMSMSVSIAAATAAAAANMSSPPPPLPGIRFSSPSHDGPSQNMPVGNGEVVANVWVDSVRGGSVALLLGRSDVFTGMHQPLKLGRLRIELDPNPFAGLFPPGASPRPGLFSQELDLQCATVNITAGHVAITVWSDINAVGSADSVHVQITTGAVPTSVSVSIDSWRTEPSNVNCKNDARGPCIDNFTLLADSFVSESYYSDPFYALGWYRRNTQSVFAATMREQRLGELATSMPDPLMNRSSGALVLANSDGTKTFLRTNATHAVSAGPAAEHTVSIITHTAAGSPTVFDFLKQMDLRAKASTAPAAALQAHTAWWKAFWQRSWIVLKAVPGDSKAAAAAALSEAYTLNRYLLAIQSRGNLPVHHNGGTVTWGWNGSSHADPDYRSWGGGYWFQNVRHSYWYALGAGDTDLMRPLYKMYMGQLPVMRARSVEWYGHNGSRFAETSYFYGAFEPCDYGCNRKPSDPPDPISPYIKNHIQGGVELATMLLHDYAHTRNSSLLAEVVLPWCESLLEFYDEHFPKYDNGTLFLQHAQSCETWPDCDNPAAQVAALMRIAEGLRAVPARLLSARQRGLFGRVEANLPAIPLTTAEDGSLQVSPCEGGFPSKHVNGENVETYAIVSLTDTRVYLSCPSSLSFIIRMCTGTMPLC
eukprot:SAG31_NODE_3997_length_3678_cov_2.098351_2_plen_658_part_00